MLRLTGTAAMALAMGTSCGPSMIAQDRQVFPPSIPIKDNKLINAVDQLSKSPSGSLRLADIATLLQVELVRADHNGFGEKYVAKAREDSFSVDVFVLPDGEFRLGFARLNGQSIDHWRTQMQEKNWTAEPPILHPFMMDSFTKDGKQIRVEHNSTTVLTVTVFGLNTSRGK